MKQLKKPWGLSATRANEAANRAVCARCPQNVKFSKPLPARVGTGILTGNNGPGVAQRKISQRLGLPRSDGQLTFYATEQKKHMDSKKCTRSPLLPAGRLQTDAKTPQHRLDRKWQLQLPSIFFQNAGSQLCFRFSSTPLQLSESSHSSYSTALTSAMKAYVINMQFRSWPVS